MVSTESQSNTDGVKAGLLQCHGPPAVSAHRQGARDQKGEQRHFAGRKL